MWSVTRAAESCAKCGPSYLSLTVAACQDSPAVRQAGYLKRGQEQARGQARLELIFVKKIIRRKLPKTIFAKSLKIVWAFQNVSKVNKMILSFFHQFQIQNFYLQISFLTIIPFLHTLSHISSNLTLFLSISIPLTTYSFSLFSTPYPIKLNFSLILFCF